MRIKVILCDSPFLIKSDKWAVVQHVDAMNFLLLLLFFGVLNSYYAQVQESRLEKLKNVRYFAFTKENPDEIADIRDVIDGHSGNLTTVLFIVHGFFKI